MTSDDIYSDDQIDSGSEEDLDESESLDDESYGDDEESFESEEDDDEDEGVDDDEDSDEDEEPGEDPGDEDEESEEPEKAPSELENLRSQVAQYERYFSQLQQQQAFHQQQQAQAAQRPAEPKAPSAQAMEVAKLLLQHGERAQPQLQGLPEEVLREGRDLATKAVRDANERDLQFSVDPQGWVQKLVAPYVERMLEEQLAPLKNSQQQAYWQSRCDEYPDVFNTPDGVEAASEVARIAAKLDPANPARVFDEAVEIYQGRKSRAALSKREQKVSGKERQQRAVKRARRKAGRQGNRKNKSRATLSSSEDDLVELARQIEATGDYDDLGLIVDRSSQR